MDRIDAYTDLKDSPKTVTVRTFGRWEMFVFFAGWTISLALLLFWSWQRVESNMLQMARIHARALFEKDVTYREWNTEHGGVYAPVTEKTQPNPYLHVPEKNIETPSGRKLTLVNPAYMTRQVHEMGQSRSGITSRLTSLHPIRPENAPDPWEKKALEALGKGSTEVGVVAKVGGRDVYRYMAPLFTEKECLRCHEAQGYKEGDLRGGISITLPLEPYLALQRTQKIKEVMLVGLIWFLGVMGMGGAFHSIRNREKALRKYQMELRSRSHFLQTVLDSTRDGISVLDQDLRIRMVNKVMEEWYASSVPLLGKKCHEAYHGKDHPCSPCPTRRALQSGHREQDIVRGFPGSAQKWLELHAYPLNDPESGAILGVVEFVRDVTERVEAEQELRRIKTAVEHAQNFIVITDARGGIFYANPYFEKYTGFTLDEIRGKLPLILQALPDGERVFREELLPVLKKGEVWAQRTHAFIRDGSKVYVDVTA